MDLLGSCDHKTNYFLTCTINIINYVRKLVCYTCAGICSAGSVDISNCKNGLSRTVVPVTTSPDNSTLVMSLTYHVILHVVQSIQSPSPLMQRRALLTFKHVMKTLAGRRLANDRKLFYKVYSPLSHVVAIIHLTHRSLMSCLYVSQNYGTITPNNCYHQRYV